MRLLFISPNQCRLVFLPLPLGLALVVASVPSEHEVRVLDFMFLEDPLAEVDRAVAEFRPDLVGISVRNIDNQDSLQPEVYFPQIKELVDRLKELGPAPVILGGAGFSVAPREFMEYTGADFGMVGEAEEAFVRFLQAFAARAWEKVPNLIWRQDGGAQRKPPQAHSPDRGATAAGPGAFQSPGLSGDPGQRQAAGRDSGAEPPGLPHAVHLLHHAAAGGARDPGLGPGAGGLLAGGLAGAVGPEALLFRG